MTAQKYVVFIRQLTATAACTAVAVFVSCPVMRRTQDLALPLGELAAQPTERENVTIPTDMTI